MGTGRKKGPSGGGISLNFKVVSNPQPANPKENTIWLNTDVDITGYYFQAEQPENMAEGEVWISTGTVSSVAFNAVKKGTVMVYPISAKQMVGGTLVDVIAKSYQGGAWVGWMLSIIPNKAIEWQLSKNENTVAYDGDVAKISVISAVSGASYVLTKVDVSSYTTLKIKSTSISNTTSTGKVTLYEGIFSEISNTSFVTGYSGNVGNGDTTNVDNTYDVSGIDGEVYVGFMLYQGGSTGKLNTTTFTVEEFTLA